jgi:ABC-type Fe3+ transport system substrate-binding protein
MDDLQITHWCLGIPKNAQHSAVAKLFIAWMLSPEGQKLVYQYQGGDLHYLPGSQTAIIITQIEKSTGQKFVDLTPAKLIADFQRESQLQSQVAKIFRSASLN